MSVVIYCKLLFLMSCTRYIVCPGHWPRPLSEIVQAISTFFSYQSTNSYFIRKVKAEQEGVAIVMKTCPHAKHLVSRHIAHIDWNFLFSFTLSLRSLSCSGLLLGGFCWEKTCKQCRMWRGQSIIDSAQLWKAAVFSPSFINLKNWKDKRWGV